MLHVFGGGRNCGSSRRTLTVGFLVLRFISLLWGLLTKKLGPWRRRMKKSWVLGVWNMVPLAIWWATWKERNRRIFVDKVLSFQDFKIYFLRLLYSWSVGFNGNKSLKILAFVDCIMRALGHNIFVLPLLYMGDITLVSI